MIQIFTINNLLEAINCHVAHLIGILCGCSLNYTLTKIGLNINRTVNTGYNDFSSKTSFLDCSCNTHHSVFIQTNHSGDVIITCSEQI